jgi:polysaccharide deacetylase 2 family uncharacterized protein YibQ
MVAAALKKPAAALWPKTKLALIEAWAWLNRNSQVDTKLFLIVFGAGFVLLVLVWVAIPTWKPKPVVDPRTQGTHSQVMHSVMPDALNPKVAVPNTPVQQRDFNEREQQAIHTNDNLGHEALIAAPVDALEEGPANARIPKIADDGRRPWFVYSRPFDRLDPRPRIAVVMADMGINRVLSESAIETLPGPISLIFNADSNTMAWVGRARNAGHEVLLSAPMEPLDYPQNDPGPGTLLTNIPPENNMKRLYYALGKGTGYVGVTTLSGSRYTSDADQLRPIMRDLLGRGLLWFDARLVALSSSYATAQEIKMPVVRTDFRILSDKSIEDFNQILADAETSARHAGTATIVVYPSPMSVQAIIDWARTLPEKGFALAPVTAMVD